MNLKTSSLLSQRTYAAQVLMGHSESLGVELMRNYTETIGQRFANVLGGNFLMAPKASKKKGGGEGGAVLTKEAPSVVVERGSSFSEDAEDDLLSLLLSEAQGGIRLTPKLMDVELSTADIPMHLDARQRFRLGVGLAKLGLFDLSLRHVSMSATPWEAPLYRLRAKLIFSPIHRSVRALAEAVDVFETQAETLLARPSGRSRTISLSPQMIAICNSPNEAALALQALPLLHLAGYSSPRAEVLLGHSPVSLPVLLGEVFVNMCPTLKISPALEAQSIHFLQPRTTVPVRNTNSSGVDVKGGVSAAMSSFSGQDITSTSTSTSRGIRIGVVAGSFDGILGRLIVGA